MKASELVLAPNGAPYHIHINGEQMADNVILVGDPGRVEIFKEIFETVEHESINRELHALTGWYHGERFTALSTGMGCDNIDIVMTELDVAANIDLATGEINPTPRRLNLVRIGTCGSLQAEIDCGTLVASRYVIGLDGLLNYYDCSPTLFEQEMQQAFVEQMRFADCFARPYAVACSERLLESVGKGLKPVITATATGFYAPQGRHIRIAPAIKDFNERIARFEWDGLRLTNLEMETSGIYGMARMFGHEALTVCLVIANRATGRFINDYEPIMKESIVRVLESFPR